MTTASRTLKLLVATCMVVCFSNSPARSIVPPSAEVSAARADIVAEVLVSDTSEIRHGDILCGYTYLATVTRVLKGPVEKQTKIRFGYLGSLDLHHAYRVYLVDDPSGHQFIAHLRDLNGGGADIDALIKTCRHRYDIGTTYFRADKLGQPK
ncbi:hypothetical protein [Ideonella paludis]|uniref:Secreted protein n=1 Tax=Ideonella paludis TaxID=1233411 RepID=A0ABS5DZ92_9BURK|nr:hypothetical protein [Ideonella paludis]MBQ0936141.1 hypothetical protein [Ideonella paludis]